jgi:hypothetical protein
MPFYGFFAPARRGVIFLKSMGNGERFTDSMTSGMAMERLMQSLADFAPLISTVKRLITIFGALMEPLLALIGAPQAGEKK